MNVANLNSQAVADMEPPRCVGAWGLPNFCTPSLTPHIPRTPVSSYRVPECSDCAHGSSLQPGTPTHLHAHLYTFPLPRPPRSTRSPQYVIDASLAQRCPLLPSAPMRPKRLLMGLTTGRGPMGVHSDPTPHRSQGFWDLREGVGLSQDHPGGLRLQGGVKASAPGVGRTVGSVRARPSLRPQPCPGWQAGPQPAPTCFPPHRRRLPLQGLWHLVPQ